MNFWWITLNTSANTYIRTPQQLHICIFIRGCTNKNLRELHSLSAIARGWNEQIHM